ncbi:glycosyltransferase family 52 [Acinetobacter baumannii]|uniref:Gtr13 n=1 Tax=Acinetobacter baumannii TaxID=470 RepID=V5RAA6_ACIBA|nr:glycosyltransferase family 52 [Acinetobacter baumannii]AHB32216.1 Gtr13 [Acinetobacter baumannii]MDC4786807.1 glycosyltransferase family 52 protein [Acinetobacter baumannii]MDH2583508.1 glycosyltransferase family 52 [Acinetobacter baumannii]PSE10870.1 polysaccharide biosynthesis protein [Acinetobacter baumannii]HEO1818028.1 polysaccharide biosynthesis protein [Acinetobacter baumannii]
MSDKKTSLVICFTPLQMLIAEKIVAQQPSVDLIVVALNNNEKYIYYYNNFHHPNITKQYYLFDNNKSKFFKFINIVKFNKNFKLEKFYENIYVSSIDNKYTHKILSTVNFKNLYTYDDGAANVVKNSIYFKQTFMSKLKDILFKLMGVEFNLNKIKKISRKHYTIYKGIQNIVEQTEYISIIEKKEDNRNISVDQEIKIFLGQPLKDIDKNFDVLALKKLLVMEGINYHFRHPRETDEAFFEEIKSSYIFEDFFAKELSKYRKVIIYTLSSTAALNIISLDNVEVRLINNDAINIRYPDLVRLFINSGAVLLN